MYDISYVMKQKPVPVFHLAKRIVRKFIKTVFPASAVQAIKNAVKR